MIKQNKNAGTCRDKKEKAIKKEKKITIQLQEINQKVLTKEGTLNRYRNRVKQYRHNRTFQNNEKKSLLISGRRRHKNIPTSGCKRNRTILN